MVIYFYMAGKCQGYPNVLLLPLTSVLQLVVSLKTLKSSSAPSEGCRVKTGCGSLSPSFSSVIHHILVSAHPAGIDCSRKPPDFRNFQTETDSHLLSTAPCSLATGERAMRFRGSKSPSLSIEEVKWGSLSLWEFQRFWPPSRTSKSTCYSYHTQANVDPQLKQALHASRSASWLLSCSRSCGAQNV